MSSQQKKITKRQRESELEPEPEPEPRRPVTRAKNATQRPGIEAEKMLRVRRDPAVVQEEKDAKKRRKEEKKRAQQEEAARNEAAARFVEENRAQQSVTMAEEEASMPRCRSQVLRAKDPKVRRAQVCETVAGLVLQGTQVTNADPWMRDEEVLHACKQLVVIMKDVEESLDDV